jgi:hypothetical protein
LGHLIDVATASRSARSAAGSYDVRGTSPAWRRRARSRNRSRTTLNADRARDRLDDHRGDGRGIVQRAQALQVLGQLATVLRLPARERVAPEIERVAQVIHARQHRAEGTPVGGRDLHPAIQREREVCAVGGRLAAWSDR